MAIQPIRMPGPTNVPGARVAPPRPPRVVVSQGGRAARVRQQAPARVAPKAPAVTPDQAATNSAMAAFQTALAQLKASTPPVDAAAIHAPYTASEAVTGQLGTGYQQAQQNAGAAASQQYTQGLNDAQKAAASFGISAGAGANPTQLQNTGTAPLASQTLANSAGAAAGVQQWQQLLERAAANKISDATVGRQNSLTSGEQGLSATIPQAIMNEKTLANSRDASRVNAAYLRASLQAKGQAQFDSNLLKQEGITAGITKTKIQQQGANARNTATITGANNRTTQTITAADRRQAKALAARQKTAVSSGLKGVAAVTAAITKTSTVKGSKPVTGYYVTYPTDPNGVNAGAPPLSTYVPAGQTQKPPTGYLAPLNQGKPVYGQATTGTTSGGGLTGQEWDTYMRSLLAQNRGVPGAAVAIKAFLGPRPAK